jgi:tRNA(fMet)-specific endonuclease VapC
LKRYLLDTNILIAAMRGHADVRERLYQIDAPALALSSVVLGELLVGVEKSRPKARNRAALESIIASLPVVPVNAEVSRAFGALRAELELPGTPIGVNDFWIAAQAFTFDMVLVTDNVGEFSRVSALKLENRIRVG